MTKSYPALRTIAVFFKVLAWISLVGGLIAFIGGIVVMFMGNRGGMEQGLSLIFAGPLLGVLYFVIFYASSEMIYVLIDISDNTRRTADMIANQTPRPAPPVAAPPPAAKGPVATPPPATPTPPAAPMPPMG